MVYIWFACNLFQLVEIVFFFGMRAVFVFGYFVGHIRFASFLVYFAFRFLVLQMSIGVSYFMFTLVFVILWFSVTV